MNAKEIRFQAYLAAVTGNPVLPDATSLDSFAADFAEKAVVRFHTDPIRTFPAELTMPQEKSLEDEEFREYEYCDQGSSRIYRIDNPVTLFVGATTHRVVDKTGLVHCLPAPGRFACVLRWKPRDASNPVAF